LTKSKHRDMLILRIKGSRPRDPTTDPSWIARGLHPLGALAGTLRLRHQSLSTPCASAWDSRVRPSPRIPIEGSMDPILSSFPAFGSSKGPGSRQTPRATKARGLPGSPCVSRRRWTCPLWLVTRGATNPWPTSSFVFLRVFQVSIWARRLTVHTHDDC